MQVHHAKAGLLLASLFFAASLPSAAKAELSFTAQAISLYKYRGVDQDGRDNAARPALQGSAEYAAGNGLYTGVWASTGRFERARAEFDLYAGYRNALTDDLSYDIGYVHYLYPNEASWNSGEVYLGLDYAQWSLRAYRGTRQEVNRGDMYYSLAYALPLTERWTLDLGVGYADVAASGVRKTTDYQIGLAYELQPDLTLSMTWAGANHKHAAEMNTHANRLVAALTMAW